MTDSMRRTNRKDKCKKIECSVGMHAADVDRPPRGSWTEAVTLITLTLQHLEDEGHSVARLRDVLRKLWHGGWKTTKPGNRTESLFTGGEDRSSQGRPARTL
jgi:hypothetical protein